jgi:hypothetical protein
MPLQATLFLQAQTRIERAGRDARDAGLSRHPSRHDGVMNVADMFDTPAERCALFIAFMDAWDIRDAELCIADDLGARVAA